MVATVTVQFDKAKLRSIQNMLKGIPGAMPKVMTRGINKTVGAAVAEIKRVIADDVNVQKKDISKAIKVHKATYGRWVADIDVYSKRIPLFKFRGKTGAKKTVMISTTPKQSAWLYFNVFRDKYGEAAIFSRSYTIKQKRYIGASYEIDKGKRETMRGDEFMATMKSGHKGIFSRKHPGSNRITESAGPSIGGFLEKRGRIKKVETKAVEKLTQNIDMQVKLMLERRR